MINTSLFTKFKDVMFNKYAHDGGKMLVHMGALGWGLSSAAQIFAIFGDKKIDKDKRKFLVPQEGADALVNVLMYYSLCDLIKKGSDLLVERGLLASGKVVDGLLGIKPKTMPNVTQANWRTLFNKSELKSLSKTLSNISNVSMLQNLSPAENAQARIQLAKIASDFKSFKNGMGVLAAITASVIACNVVTPYVRNKVANKAKTVLSKRESIQKRKEQIVNNITTKNPLPVSFSAFQKYNTYSNIKI